MDEFREGYKEMPDGTVIYCVLANPTYKGFGSFFVPAKPPPEPKIYTLEEILAELEQ